ncbi:MAG: hypothetical protein ONB48_18900 [candidate division KSB1 bacterium]|nr:hypothetical protein [candidate division KSB1 bacterium]MDZ7276331.1 hypothetical protein [candidate division KSB1 bacterium]MDZ7287716.1 hypothetical protein [candidate division KSB1 bacterium]MDZ7299944.1 hypothetical protein [candidate division KSB1 bacterium]MDZ7305727.1 hypothetical protein [candidate division KSB1 bacterium]
MEASEHFYSDDPALGPPDVRTMLAGIDYYFLGNGHLTAAVQICTSGEGTPVGLLLMSPDHFGPKRKALSFDPQTGLAATMLRLETGGAILAADPASVKAFWLQQEKIPTVAVFWETEEFAVRERFFCPDRSTPRLVRALTISNISSRSQHVTLHTGVRAQQLTKDLPLAGGETKQCFVEYCLTAQGSEQPAVLCRWSEPQAPLPEAANYWQQAAAWLSDSPVLNHLFHASCHQLQAVISARGRCDSSCWQYNLEWTRDQAMMVQALVCTGQWQLAATMLERMLTEFVTPAGDTVDSSRRRPPAEVELDQNGILLHTLQLYCDWTGDLALIRRHWPRICATADLPLQPVFRHPETFLLHNQREFWERHHLFGIEDGMELMYQFYPALGLRSAARLAELLGEQDRARGWLEAAQAITQAMLFDPKFCLIENGHFIKRRRLNGEVQTETFLREPETFPASIPLRQPGPHYLNPDSAAALPIALEFIDPRSELAQRTLAHLEGLWNTNWTGGGYGRYHYTSEPDSPGPWPFASLFIARAWFEAGNDEKVWRVLHWLTTVPGGRAGAWFEFYGPRPIPPCPQIGIIPWTWAEIIILCIHHVLGIRPEWRQLRLRPRLLAGMNWLEATVRVRDTRLAVRIERVAAESQTGWWIDGQPQSKPAEGFTLPWPAQNLSVLVKQK